MLRDHQEIFTFKDGGKILINYYGKGFKQGKKEAPLLFLIPGLTSTDETGYIKNTIMAANDKGYDVVLINYRGLGGCELATP